MRQVVVATAVLLLVPGLACSGSSPSDHPAAATTVPATQSPPTAVVDAETSTTTEGPPTQWVAVYRSEPYPEAERAQFIDDAGPYVCECVVGSFPGLDAAIDVDPGTYFLGLVAQSADDLENAQGRIAGDPIFIGELPSLLND